MIVRVKTWFNPSTISAHRGDSPLTPNRRRVVLVDEKGRIYGTSLEGQTALASLEGPSALFSQALRPGRSYFTDLVFDVPRDARALRVLLTEDDPETCLVIGHENSFLHKKIFLSIDSAPALSSTQKL